MNFLKEFLRPNRWKIGLLIALVLLVVGSDFVFKFTYDPDTYVPCGLEQSNIECKQPWALQLLRNISFILILPLFMFVYEPRWPFSVWLGIVVNIFYLYFLPCLLYFAFTRLKKRLISKSGA